LIIHDMNAHALPRHVQNAPKERLRVMPAVVVTGARQAGKSTLVQLLTPGERRFHSLDEFEVADLAARDPEALLAGSSPVTIDEVQRQPSLLSAVKRAIDRKPRAGQFLLTESANLLLMRQVSECLAGRASYLTLWPMTRCEQDGTGRCGLWEELLASEEGSWLDLLRGELAHSEDWRPLA
jgi:predicted AAA+ superfamily ATPase